MLFPLPLKDGMNRVYGKKATPRGGSPAYMKFYSIQKDFQCSYLYFNELLSLD